MILNYVDILFSRLINKSPQNILVLLLWITNKCDSRCIMCDHWKTEDSLLKQELSTEQWYKVIDSAKKMNTRIISITGGEPLLRDDIFDILDYIKKKNISTHLNTNARHINEETAEKLANAGIHTISISIDGPTADVHNYHRGIDCFDSVVRSVRTLREKLPQVRIGINYLITSQNYKEMVEMIFFAENLKVDQLKFMPIHTNLSHKYQTSFDNLLFEEKDFDELKHELQKLEKEQTSTKLHTGSRTFTKGIYNFFSGKKRTLPCYAGYVSCTIDALGFVRPCYDIESPHNIKDTSLEEIWKSKVFNELRKRVQKCSTRCWDTTHGELAIRCNPLEAAKEIFQIVEDMKYYKV